MNNFQNIITSSTDHLVAPAFLRSSKADHKATRGIGFMNMTTGMMSMGIKGAPML